MNKYMRSPYSEKLKAERHNAERKADLLILTFTVGAISFLIGSILLDIILR